VTTAPAPLILLIDDEAPIRRFLGTTLAAHGYRYDEATTAREGIVQVSARPPDVILLDLGLPDMDGLELAQQIRSWSAIPIIVLSARGQEQDKVKALDAGADDYLTKPFGVPELLARIRVALRHAARGEDDGQSMYAFAIGGGDGFRIDLARRLVWKRTTGEEREVRLTPTEFRLLAKLVKHNGRVLTHGQILREVWGTAHEHDVAYLRVYMGQLRHKLEADPARPAFLLTEPGVGYRLVEADARAQDDRPE
jgi:two-component system KDP operon response regulator KdpE